MRTLFIVTMKRVFAMFVIMCAFITVNAQTTNTVKKNKWDFAVSGYYDASNICTAKIMEDLTLGYNIGKMATVSLDALMTFSDQNDDTWGMFVNGGVHPRIAKNIELTPYVGIGMLSGNVNGKVYDARLAGQVGVNARYCFKNNVYCGIGAKGIISGAHCNGAFAGVSVGYKF